MDGLSTSHASRLRAAPDGSLSRNTDLEPPKIDGNCQNSHCLRSIKFTMPPARAGGMPIFLRSTTQDWGAPNQDGSGATDHNAAALVEHHVAPATVRHLTQPCLRAYQMEAATHVQRDRRLVLRKDPR